MRHPAVRFVAFVVLALVVYYVIIDPYVVPEIKKLFSSATASK